ncbi:MAG: class I SAM-dependent methyltransferase [Cyanosarcina radialis HA8281-LM2]|jgi:2-polyprenyl-6-hydroxyphenyl methylase/3-demethylubiquinone-9 3-methyltransferase|nr:class I SAM-dependent methyltransferase [Cyanosarcina radialis HA8281-LM2]
MSLQHAAEIKSGNRFAFGENWARFLTALDEDRIRQAEQSLCDTLKMPNLKEKRFLDVGSGSGLFSLAARRLGAKVRSFDYDPESVACTEELKRRYFPDDPDWQVEQGSALDAEYLKSLDRWDIVYSWGVLHHTGNMSQALANVSDLVADGGSLFISIYNDQGRASRFWLKVKQTYNQLPPSWRWLILWPAAFRIWGPTTIRDLAAGKPFHTWRNYSKGSSRGMSPWRDVIDWVGGLPFEVARPEEIIFLFQDRGFRLDELMTCAGGHGCNEYVFKKV